MSEKIRKLINDERSKRGWTHQQLADAAGMQRPSVTAYLSGAKDIETKTLERLLDALGLELQPKKK